jgi:twitching motility two-component system response regulator PilH
MATILLIEDSRFQRAVSEQILTQAGYDVIAAEDGEQALTRTWRHRPDVVLLDMLLPKLGGQDVLQYLKQDPSTRNIPVIVLTGLPQEHAKPLLQAGAGAFLQKGPVLQNPELLLRTVAEILSRAQLSNTVVCMRGDLQVCWQNRQVPQAEAVYNTEFFPAEATGKSPSAKDVHGKANLERLLADFGVAKVYLDVWMKKLNDEDILIPYVALSRRLQSFYEL